MLAFICTVDHLDQQQHFLHDVVAFVYDDCIMYVDMNDHGLYTDKMQTFFEAQYPKHKFIAVVTTEILFPEFHKALKKTKDILNVFPLRITMQSGMHTYMPMLDMFELARLCLGLNTYLSACACVCYICHTEHPEDYCCALYAWFFLSQIWCKDFTSHDAAMQKIIARLRKWTIFQQWENHGFSTHSSCVPEAKEDRAASISRYSSPSS